MKQGHVFRTPLVPLITIALFGDFWFNSVYSFCKLIRAHSHLYARMYLAVNIPFSTRSLNHICLSISNVRFSSEFNYSPVSTSYICNILDHLNPRKAVGVDGISPRILRLGSPVLAEKVTNLINFCILNRSLPSEWKQARLTPVFKRGVDTDKANYRPVSILTSLS